MKRREEEVIADLGVAQQFKLMLHREKGDWSHKDMLILVNELRREVDELEEAIESSNKEHIISECADVANYCAFIIEKIKGK